MATNLSIWELYQEQYEKSAKQVERFGYAPDEPPFESMLELDTELQALRNGYQMENKKIPSDSSLAIELAKSHVYHYSHETAMSWRQSMIEQGFEDEAVYIRLRMEGIEGTRFDQAVKERNEELRREGKDSKERARIIGAEYFGSP